MTAIAPERIDTGLAIAELVDGNVDHLRGIEGHLLTASADSTAVTPAGIASDLDLSLTVARDICRQLEAADAITRTATPADPEHTEYDCDPDRCSTILETAVTVTRVLQRDEERRQPFPSVEPLATLPADPSFSEFTPQDIGFDWLMPRLSSAINRSSSDIDILMPFFEQGGFSKLQPDLAAALDRGVSVTIVTRYLSDTDSNNYEVLSEFVDHLRDESISRSNLQFVEYAPRSAGGESAEQEGPAPAFTLHAKVMVFDDEAVYIGSANVTDYGFDRYLELGVLIGGLPVASYSQIVDRLLESPSAMDISL